MRSFVLWHRGWPLGRATVRSAIVGMAVILVAGVLLAVFNQLGLSGRF